MDAQKLLRVLQDIVDYETANNIAGELDTLASQIAENTPAAFEQAQAIRKNINALLSKSPANAYAPSYEAILISIEAEELVGNHAITTIDAIFSSGPLGLNTRLIEFTDNYRQHFDKYRQAIKSMQNIDLVAYENNDFEVGFIVPKELNDLQGITNHLFYWDRFLVICSEIAGNETPSIPLSRVSNGSWEFFVVQGVGVAKIVQVVLKHVLELYQEALKIKKIYAEIDSLNANTDVYKAQALEALAKAELSQRELYIKQATDEVMSGHFKSFGDRKPELSTQLAVALKVVLADIQKGIKLEVSPPATKPSKEKPQPERDQVIKQLSNQNKELRKLYSSPDTVKALPFDVKVTVNELEKLKPKKKAVTKMKAPSKEQAKPDIKKKS